MQLTLPPEVLTYCITRYWSWIGTGTGSCTWKVQKRLLNCKTESQTRPRVLKWIKTRAPVSLCNSSGRERWERKSSTYYDLAMLLAYPNERPRVSSDETRAPLSRIKATAIFSAPLFWQNWKNWFCSKWDFAHNTSVTSIGKQTKQNTSCKNTVIYGICLVSTSVERLNLSRIRDWRVESMNITPFVKFSKTE